MKKLNRLLPFSLLLLLPLWHGCHELNSSLSLLLNLIVYKGFYIFIKEIFTFPIVAIIVALIFHLFIKYVAPKFSLSFGSIILLISSYLILPASFFYDNLGIFFLCIAFRINRSKQTEHLFFSLFYITLLHTFSSLLICCRFYGFDYSLFFISCTPALCLYLLMSRSTYPSKITLLSLFPLTLFPVSHFVHNPTALSFSIISCGLLLLLSIYVLLNRRKTVYISICLSLSLIQLVVIPHSLQLPLALLPVVLLISLMQIFYAAKHHPSSHISALPRPMQPFSPSLRFYSEHMHY